MAVQVPSGVQRFQDQPTASVGRVQAEIPNSMSAIQPQNEAVSNAIDAAAKFVIKKEDDAAETKSTELANQYERERLERLNGKDGIVHLKGDVTAAYEKYRTDGQERMNQILADSDEYSDLTKRKLQAKLQEVDQRYYVKSTITQGKQNNDYITDTANDRVELLKNDLQTSTGLLDVNDPASFAPMKSNIGAIIQERYKMAEQLNIPKESVNLQIAKDLSGGIESSISTLNSSNRPDLAEEVIKQYGDFLDARTRPRAIEETRKKKIDVTAMAEAETAMGKGTGAQAYLDKIKDDETRTRAWEFFDSSRRRHEYEKKRVNDDTYNRLAGYVEKRMASGNPFQSRAELEMDPMYANSIRYVTEADDVKKIHKLLETDESKESDPAVFNAAMNSFRTGELVALSPDQLAGKLAGLNKTDKRMFNNLYISETKDTDSQRRSRFDWSADRVRDRMRAAGVLKYADGKMTASSQKVWSAMESDLLRNFSKLPKNMDEAQLEKEIDKLVVKEVEKYNNDSWTRRMGFGRLKAPNIESENSPIEKTVPRRSLVPNSPLLQNRPSSQVTNSPLVMASPTATPSRPSTAPGQAPKTGPMSDQQMREGTAAFRKANGRSPKSAAELKEFLNNRGQ